ncbi:MAG: Rab family GTPase [Promethearchaeota archaeon]
MKTPNHQTSQKKVNSPDNNPQRTSRMQYLKVVMLGDAAVGKTSLVSRYVHKSFIGKYKATIGLDLSFRDVEIPGKGTTRLQMWDLSGQAQFKTIRQRFFDGTSGAVLVFDITRPSTFENLNSWLIELTDNVGQVPFAVVGNKADLKDLIASDETEEKKWAEENEAVTYLRTSAKTGENVDQVFNFLAKEIIEKGDKPISHIQFVDRSW